MIVSKIGLTNWRNFRHVDVSIQERQFIVGPNASGKSNFLDALRFLRDVASKGGGLQKAVIDRGGIPKIRSLAARQDPKIEISVTLSEINSQEPKWQYSLSFVQEPRGKRQIRITNETVTNNGRVLLNRPNQEDEKDPERLTQTFLEQINSNQEFREIAIFFQEITYLHLVPQLLRFAETIQGQIINSDPFGQGFLERIAKTADKTRASRLHTIESALKMAVPQLEQLSFKRDETSGKPHIQALYSHWRPNAGWQREDQFSDGTLRLLALLWSLLENNSLLLLEEPELSLNSGIVSHLAPLIYKMQKRRKRQVFISTHSEALMSDSGIDGTEVIMLIPANEGTKVEIASNNKAIKILLESGLSVSDVVMPKTRPSNGSQLLLFEE